MANKFEATHEVVIHSIKTCKEFIQKGNSLQNCTLQNIDFSKFKIKWEKLLIDNTAFLGCNLTLEEEFFLRKKGATIIAAPEDLPYNPFRHSLYSWQELMDGYSVDNDQSIDLKIYQHFSTHKYNPGINEALWQRIHDHSIDDALRDLLEYDKDGMTKKKCIGFMGGHSTRRDDIFYEKTALTARLLAREGYLVVSGGGPGIMEATNLGAYFADKPESVLIEAINMLKQAPHYTDRYFQERAKEVIEQFPNGAVNLAIPTWFYGHEPSNLFASHIAKYFSNSIREDTLLAISLYGIICAPGSAGTIQEIFMDATQNHYGTFNYHSPMVFLGKEHYEIKTLVYPLLRQLAWGKQYFDLLYISDEPRDITDFILSNSPIPVK